MTTPSKDVLNDIMFSIKVNNFEDFVTLYAATRPGSVGGGGVSPVYFVIKMI